MKKRDFSKRPIPAPRMKKRDFSKRPIPAPRILLNIKNPEINVPVLQPEIAVVEEKKAPTVIKKTVATFSEWMDWLVESGKKYIVKPISEKLQNLKNKINAIFAPNFTVRDGPSALKEFVREKIIDGQPGFDPKSFFAAIRNLVLEILPKNTPTKVKMILACKMKKTDLKTNEEIEIDTEFHSEIEINLEGTNHESQFEKMVSRIEEILSNFQQNGSNWVFEQIKYLEIHLTDWVPIRGSSFIPLPSAIATKKAVINIKNDDNECFKWCVARALTPVEKNAERINLRLRQNAAQLNWEGLKFPVKLKDIKIFEKNNPDISINVFGFEKGLFPLRIQKEKKRQIIDLLLIADDEKQHYCLIKNLSRLVSSSYSKHCGLTQICRSCLNHFSDEQKLAVHEEYCWENKIVKIEMPKKPILEFQHYNRSIKVPFVIYADFEAFTKKVNSIGGDDARPWTEKYQKHQPCGFCYKIVGKEYQKSVLYRAKGNEDIGEEFIKSIEKDVKKILKKFDLNKKMDPLTKKN